jgi:hypothetical protein
MKIAEFLMSGGTQTDGLKDKQVNKAMRLMRFLIIFTHWSPRIVSTRRGSLEKTLDNRPATGMQTAAAGSPEVEMTKSNK